MIWTKWLMNGTQCHLCHIQQWWNDTKQWQLPIRQWRIMTKTRPTTITTMSFIWNHLFTRGRKSELLSILVQLKSNMNHLQTVSVLLTIDECNNCYLINERSIDKLITVNINIYWIYWLNFIDCFIWIKTFDSYFFVNTHGK